MRITIGAVESAGFYDGECHIYIEMYINEGNLTKDFFNESFEIAEFLNIDLKEYIERSKKYMAKLGYKHYTFTSEIKLDDIEFLIGDYVTKEKLIQIKGAFEEEFIKELTMVTLTWVSFFASLFLLG